MSTDSHDGQPDVPALYVGDAVVMQRPTYAAIYGAAIAMCSLIECIARGDEVTRERVLAAAIVNGVIVEQSGSDAVEDDGGTDFELSPALESVMAFERLAEAIEIDEEVRETIPA